MEEKKQSRPEFISTDIPKLFHSYSSGKPFEKCINCECSLLDPNVHYIVQKTIRRYEGYQANDVIVEFAICLQCAEEMRMEMSQESMQNIQNYFEGNTDLLRRRQELFDKNQTDPNAWVEECLVSGCNVNQTTEYQIAAHCSGNQLHLGLMPYMISGPVMAEISDLISQKTQDELDRFSDEHFGLPPEWRQSLSRTLVLT